MVDYVADISRFGAYLGATVQDIGRQVSGAAGQIYNSVTTSIAKVTLPAVNTAADVAGKTLLVTEAAAGSPAAVKELWNTSLVGSTVNKGAAQLKENVDNLTKDASGVVETVKWIFFLAAAALLIWAFMGA